MFANTKTKARKVPPTHQWWMPHEYQDHATDFLLDRGAAALVLDPGLGKTSVVFNAFCRLQEEKLAKKMLVVAPLRVCQLVWRQEALKWTQFKHLKISLVHGSKKEQALKQDADIYLINPEGVAWLAAQFWGKKFPFDTVVIDELTKFKNAQSVRHKKLLPMLKKVKRRWGLTGTFLPNGYLDLFGQMKILDDGTALGFYYTHFRNKFFEKGYDGFSFKLRRGADVAIEAAIKPYVLRMSADDYLELPPLIDDIRSVEMPPKARVEYETMKKEMVTELDGDLIEAGNAAAAYSKLKQMANGAVYAGDGVFEPRKVVHLHDAKIEAVEELIEELAGSPLLIGYEFNHDLDRLRKALGDVPYIGSGVSGDQAAQIEKDWNAGRIPVLLAHPASAGHGLNFQLGNAAHVAWFSCTWDYELYDQFIKRIFRQGNKALRVFNHIFIVENTIDNKTRAAILDKGLTQSGFYDALNSEIYHDGNSDASPDEAAKREDNSMTRKLERKGRKKPPKEEVEDAEYEDVDEDDEQDEDEKPARKSRRSSRRKAKAEEPEDDGDEEDEEEEDEKAARKSRRSSKRSSSGTKRKLRGKSEDDEDEDEDEDEPVSKKARKQFDKNVQERLEDDEEDEEDDDEEEEAPKKRRSTKRSPEPEGGAPAEINYTLLAEAIVDVMAKRLAG